MLANYHTHTTRCHHAIGTEREYIEKAIENGFKILGFSDHTPQPYPPEYKSGIRMDMIELENYTETLVKLREEYKNDIQLFIGLEVEYTDKYFEPLMKQVRQYPIDYIIQGQHFAPTNEIDGFYVGAETTDEADVKAYVDLTIEGMQTGLFSYLAHPDLMNYVGPDMVYQHHMKRIVKASIDLNIPLEINMQGFFLNRNYPSDRFFSMASAMGAKFVIGCDAHHPEDVMQPWQMEDFVAFLERNNIEYGDNVVELRPVK
ncbi:histidinol-phosphatase (PHP family) [Pseudobutyrivibrio sp. 49]|uniref:histidinol-phosphatase n=1 Tax=Pseudobutyrivibrio sp. 49 TaxID=1855344 RepID=UPI00088AB41B|nr:histidinol-phosphatase [Pseudobutyrivibrio sp. 49]SDH88200.1 histidinol-phosphatase (PHP family) [Pseudobutyrivibrio sp. 49]